MTDTVDGADLYAAPSTYADFFRQYYGYVVSLVRSLGISENNKEDVASEIITRFFERDFLNVYDPELLFEHEGELRPARFKSFLTKFVRTYLLGHRDRQHREQRREVLICDMPLGEAGDTNWIDVFGDPNPSYESNTLDWIAFDERVAELRDHMTKIPTDAAVLVPFFDEYVKHIRLYGEADHKVLGEEFDVGTTAIHTWVWCMREYLATALGKPVPAKRPKVSSDART